MSNGVPPQEAKPLDLFFTVCKILIILRGFFFADANCVFYISSKLVMEKDGATTSWPNQRSKLVIFL